MRFLLAFVGGLLATVALFVLMQRLIDAGDTGVREAERGAVVDFVRLRPEELIARKQRVRPKMPPPPRKRPPPPRLAVETLSRPEPRKLEIVAPRIDVPVVTGSGPYLGAFESSPTSIEGDVVPIMRIAPLYPREARRRGTQGWVRVRFTINEDGSVSNATVVEAEPRRVFNREAVRAILRWKFKPRIVNGEAVAREAEQIIEFSLDVGG